MEIIEKPKSLSLSVPNNNQVSDSNVSTASQIRIFVEEFDPQSVSHTISPSINTINNPITTDGGGQGSTCQEGHLERYREQSRTQNNMINGDEYNYHCMTLIAILLIITIILLIIIILPFLTRHESTPHIM